MKESKKQKIAFMIKELQDIGHYVEVFENGHIRVADVDFWCTTETYYDSKNKVKGKGYKRFKDQIR